jgi:hypothetical protein
MIAQLKDVLFNSVAPITRKACGGWTYKVVQKGTRILLDESSTILGRLLSRS